jgi:hypothetical protein
MKKLGIIVCASLMALAFAGVSLAEQKNTNAPHLPVDKRIKAPTVPHGGSGKTNTGSGGSSSNTGGKSSGGNYGQKVEPKSGNDPKK